MARKVRYIKLTTVEAFPVNYGHVTYKKGDGPFYAPNSETLHLYKNERQLAALKADAIRLKNEGYTLLVDVI